MKAEMVNRSTQAAWKLYRTVEICGGVACRCIFSITDGTMYDVLVNDGLSLLFIFVSCAFINVGYRRLDSIY